uniref:hypothetical protein n=1 Tax=unclassified Streptomyces TaxID=2593676 RepID=UPI003C7D6668
MNPAAEVLALGQGLPGPDGQGFDSFEVEAGEVEGALPGDGPGRAPRRVDLLQLLAPLLGQDPAGGVGGQALGLALLVVVGAAGGGTGVLQEDADLRPFVRGFCALVVAGLAQETGITFKALKSLKNKISTQPGGPGFGDWTRILQQAASATGTASLDPDHPFHELAALLVEGSDADQAATRLASRRNNHAHGRANEPLPTPGALTDAFKDLALLFERARFLADWSLLHVTSVNWDRLSASETLGYRRLTGDHPVVPTATMVVTGADRIEAGSLYLADRDQNLHPLRPFLTCEICEACSSWSIFHADKENGQLIQRSLEHGHNYPYRGNEAALRTVGLR